MTEVLSSSAAAPVGSLTDRRRTNFLRRSSLSLSSENSSGANDEDVTITLNKNNPVSPTSTLDELSHLAISAQITEVIYSISDVQTRIFEIQELRHQAEASQSSGPSAAVSSDGHGQPTDSSTTNIDQALINLDERLESIASTIANIEHVLAPVIASAKTPTTSKTLTQVTVFTEDPTGALLRKHSSMLQDWDAVQEEAETLKGELREDKWLAVFRTVGEQAEAMMVSLEKAVTHCQDFIWQIQRHRKADDGHSGISSGSMSGEKPINYEMFQSLLSSYEAKKRYYMPATTKVLAILDRSVRDRVTKNGECLRRHAEARARWKNLRERLNRIDSEMEQVRLYFVAKEREQEPEPSEAGSALSRQTSRSNYTSKSNYLSTPSTRVSALTSRSRADSSGSGGTASAFSRSMSPLKRFASKVTASVRSSGSNTGANTPSRTASSVSIPSPQPPPSTNLSAFSSSVSVADSAGPPKPPPRSPFRPPANKISAISSPTAEVEDGAREKKKRESSIFPFLSKPPPPSALGRSNNRAPSRNSMSGGDSSASGSSKPRWNSNVKVEYAQPPSQNATIRATPTRQSIINHAFRPTSPEERRSLSRSESRPPTSQGRHQTFNSVSTVDLNGAATPQRPRSRAASRAGARTPSGMYGTAPRTRPVTPSHIPAPVNYMGGRSPSRAASDSDYEDEIPTSLMQRAMESLGQGSKTPDENLRQRRQSNSMIPVPKLNITSGSRPGTALSMASRSGSPLQPGDMQKNPKESPSAWKRLSVPQDSPSNPFKDTPGGRAGARSQTPESMLRARTMQIPLYLENTSPGTSGGSPSSPHLTPGSKVRNAPSSYKGDGRTLVSSPGSNSAGGDGNAGRPPSRSISRLNSYGFGRMTPSLETPNHVYVPAKTDELDVEVAKIVNGMAHGFLFERVDPPRKTPARAGEEIKAQYAISNALNRKVITCRLVIISRGGTENKKVMCRVGGGWLELPMYILNRQAGLS
ncbi:hypothetical protein FRC18_004440 [Serendipita sp. 400]|nr:hypothetical protein FRC18_004440 [Serendipita sp. 400]